MAKNKKMAEKNGEFNFELKLGEIGVMKLG